MEDGNLALQLLRCCFTGCLAMPSWAVLGVPQTSQPSPVHTVDWAMVLSTEVGSGMAMCMEEMINCSWPNSVHVQASPPCTWHLYAWQVPAPGRLFLKV